MLNFSKKVKNLALLSVFGLIAGCGLMGQDGIATDQHLLQAQEMPASVLNGRNYVLEPASTITPAINAKSHTLLNGSTKTTPPSTSNTSLNTNALSTQSNNFQGLVGAGQATKTYSNFVTTVHSIPATGSGSSVSTRQTTVTVNSN